MRYIWFNSQWVPQDLVRRTTSSAPAVIRDLEEYQAVGLPGQPRVGSRSTHRQLLRQHGMTEIGTMSADEGRRVFNSRR